MTLMSLELAVRILEEHTKSIEAVGKILEVEQRQIELLQTQIDHLARLVSERVDRS